ncbi:uncharacterized protein [Euwallacea fornicatus]|uniref:uncharacterized protein n=1 Tax=Euwallacea fornicatus TaxID=995702 RepID=UPI00338DD3B1
MSAKGTAPSYFLIQNNPEIFAAIPRPGGVVKIVTPSKLSKVQEKALKAPKEISISASTTSRFGPKLVKSADSKPPDKEEHQLKKSLLTVATKQEEPLGLDEDQLPRDYKVKQAIAATPWAVEFDEFAEVGEQLNLSDLFQGSVDMLAISISIIMLLSRGYPAITDTQYKWLISYLNCIRDEFGRVPPNVQGVLNHINEVTGGNIKFFLDKEEGFELTH